MANPEHLAKLKEGVEAWNSWRYKNPEIQPDLSDAVLLFANLEWINLGGADLSRADLSLANLYGAYLAGTDMGRANMESANMCRANLLCAYLEGANLHQANLEFTNLYGANLGKVNLDYANLEGANLVEADLRKANFCFTNLSGSDLSLSTVADTIFSYIDLSTARGLEKVYHYSSSVIDVQTIYISQGNIPEIFLRGCGVPDQMIEYTRSLTATPIQYYSCFISYSHQDNELARRIHNDLQAVGVRCWFAPHNMKIGDKIRPVIDDSIRLHDKLLLILSEHSVQSDWVEHEVEHALERERVEKKNILFPVRMDEAVMNSTTGWAGNVKRQRHIGDFTCWKDHDAYKASFERLLRDLTNARCGIGR